MKPFKEGFRSKQKWLDSKPQVIIELKNMQNTKWFDRKKQERNI